MKIVNHCKNFGLTQTIISGLTLTTQLNVTIKLKLFAKNVIVDLAITATYHLRIYGKTEYI